MFLKVFLFFTFASISISIRLQCNFHESSWSYKCSAKSLSITSKSDRDVNFYSGQHLERRTSKKVLAFSAHSLEIFYFPRNLTQHFVNLKYISIQNSGLREIESEDLEEFGDHLVYLWLCSNQIEIIERNLFSHNKNLGFLNLNGNKIKFFEGGTIEKGLAYPHSFWFSKNKCYSGSVNYNENAVEEMVKEIEEKCTFGFMMKCQVNEMKEKIEKLEEEKIKMKERIEELEEEIKEK